MNTDITEDRHTDALSATDFFWVSLSVALYLITPLFVLFALFGNSAG
jgi:hypothetical protein